MDCFGLFDLIIGEGCVRSYEEVVMWGWDERCEDVDKVIVYVIWVVEGGGVGWYDGWY